LVHHIKWITITINITLLLVTATKQKYNTVYFTSEIGGCFLSTLQETGYGRRFYSKFW